jgi:hypothetical protein
LIIKFRFSADACAAAILGRGHRQSIHRSAQKGRATTSHRSAQNGRATTTFALTG